MISTPNDPQGYLPPPAQPVRSFHTEIVQMDSQRLSSIVGRAYSQPLKVNHWQVEPLGMVELGTQVTSGSVFQTWGQAADDTGLTFDRSLVVKIVKSAAGVMLPNGVGNRLARPGILG